MATLHVRYLVCRHGAGLPRYFWQPSSELRAQGWRPQRVPLDWHRFTDPAELHAAAIARAEELNKELDAVREEKALAATRAPIPPPIGRLLGELIDAYEKSDDFGAKADTTRRGYRQCLDRLRTWGGDMPVRLIDEVRIQRLHKGLAITPAVANAVVRVLRLLLEHGRRNGWLRYNPALRPGLSASPPSGIIWPPAAVLAFVAAADAAGRPSIGTAVLLNEWVGQRQADILRMPWSIYRGGNLVFRQRKTGASVSPPVGIVPHLAQRLEEELARRNARAKLSTTIIVSEETGLPYKADNFRHLFAEIRAVAAKTQPTFEIDYLLPGRDMEDPDAFTVLMTALTFMHLRHTAVTRLGEAECDPGLIAAISGHSEATVLDILKRYMVRTARMARLAFGKRLQAEGIVEPDAQETGSA